MTTGVVPLVQYVYNCPVAPSFGREFNSVFEGTPPLDIVRFGPLPGTLDPIGVMRLSAVRCTAINHRFMA